MKKLLIIFLLCTFPLSAAEEKEIKVRPVSEIIQEAQEEDLKAINKETSHFQRRKEFIESLRKDAEEFQKKIEKIKKPDEKNKELEKFRQSRIKKIHGFLESEKEAEAV